MSFNRTVAALSATLFLGLPVAAQARIPIRVGISEQQVAMFGQPAFQRLAIKRVRYFIPWNAMDRPDQLARARAYVEKASSQHITVLLHLSTDNYAIKHGHRPSVAEYRSAVRRMVPYFRTLGVRDFGTWNEVNHASQPTYNSPSHAALFFREMYRAVKGRCKTCPVVALDVLDQPGVERYMRSFYRRLSLTYRKRATIVGIHNYGDVNRQRTRYTSAIIRQSHVYNRHTRFWLTETGGIVKFGSSFPCNTTRASHRLSNMFSIANRYRRSGIERIYVYHWVGTGCEARFDAGLTNPDGSLRPGYTYLRKKLVSYLR